MKQEQITIEILTGFKSQYPEKIKQFNLLLNNSWINKTKGLTKRILIYDDFIMTTEFLIKLVLQLDKENVK